LSDLTNTLVAIAGREV